MTKLRRYLFMMLAATLLLSATACGDRTPVIEVEEDNSSLLKENMINANRVVIQSETTQIESYVQRRGMEMKQLPSGAMYCETQHGAGPAINPEDVVEVTYRLEALDGTPFYKHQKDTLTVGHREVTVALDDYLQQTTCGSKACIIAPSNSAYGVVGDGDRVPSRTVIIYYIESINNLYRIN